MRKKYIFIASLVALSVFAFLWVNQPSTRDARIAEAVKSQDLLKLMNALNDVPNIGDEDIKTGVGNIVLKTNAIYSTDRHHFKTKIVDSFAGYCFDEATGMGLKACIYLGFPLRVGRSV